MTFAASVGTDLFRAVLQGAPPGTVYAVIALSFALTRDGGSRRIPRRCGRVVPF